MLLICLLSNFAFRLWAIHSYDLGFIKSNAFTFTLYCYLLFLQQIIFIINSFIHLLPILKTFLPLGNSFFINFALCKRSLFTFILSLFYCVIYVYSYILIFHFKIIPYLRKQISLTFSQ